MATSSSSGPRLREVAILSGIADAEIAWLLANGELLRFEAGTHVVERGQPIDLLYLIMTGHLSYYTNHRGTRRRVAEWRAGEVTGVLPYSRLRVAPGHFYAEKDTEAWAIHRSRLGALTHECPEFTERCVHVLTDRARHFHESDLEDEKTLALGKLAAGLAHELNNPASAMVGSSKALSDRLAGVESALRALLRRQVSPAAASLLDDVREAILTSRRDPITPLERADREDAISERLERWGGDAELGWLLADSSVAIESLDRLAREIDDSEALLDVLTCVTSAQDALGLVADIEVAASRVSEMVSAVREFTAMDRAAAEQSVDIARGLYNTATVLSAKARAKQVDLNVEVDGDLPPVWGKGGELNQVWASLIDNALDAVSEGGSVHVAARAASGRVIVEVTDDGPGIPAEIRHRIFDPFFTTKGVGEGTGLGLVAAQRHVARHEGILDVHSRPGRTVFRVELPSSFRNVAEPS